MDSLTVVKKPKNFAEADFTEPKGSWLKCLDEIPGPASLSKPIVLPRWLRHTSASFYARRES